jgi:hypothetical protein
VVVKRGRLTTAQQVEVLCVNTGQHSRFYYNGWLSKTESPYRLEVIQYSDERVHGCARSGSGYHERPFPASTT